MSPRKIIFLRDIEFHATNDSYDYLLLYETPYFKWRAEIVRCGVAVRIPIMEQSCIDVMEDLAIQYVRQKDRKER